MEDNYTVKNLRERSTQYTELLKNFDDRNFHLKYIFNKGPSGFQIKQTEDQKRYYAHLTILKK